MKNFHPEILIEIHGPYNGDRVWDLMENSGYSWSHLSPAGKQAILEKRDAISLLSKEEWTQHFLLVHTSKLEMPQTN